MILGVTATSVTFIVLIISVVAYYFNYLRKDTFLLTMARAGFYTASALIFLQVILLMWGILSHKFEWVYVFSYSSTDLPLYYLISTFWAGQEGTFLLWLALGSIYGLVIIRANKDEEALVMSFMNLVQAFIVMILIKKNPFAFVWDINPQAFAAGQLPIEGSGLNPLLQDPWMVIHPPILFAGYSATMILFAFAMSALIRREYDGWVKSVYPYTLFVGLSLGAGIILGGYWAYTTLGWGGYWGWDPVENSSLIPWFTSLALIHGLIIQRKQGGMKKTNLFLALITFILVLYGTFLTRSGVLTDFSVHSFGSSELNQYLIGFVALFLGIGALGFFYRAKEVEKVKVTGGFFTKETFLFFGILIISVVTFLIFMGTSSPIITGLISTASNVSIVYYNQIAAPFAVLIALLIGISPILRWKENDESILKSLIVPAIISIVIGVISFVLGARDFFPLLIIITSAFLVLVNGQLMVSAISRKNYNIGGPLSHVGVGLMMIGIITSSVYDSSERTTLPLGSPQNVLGYELTYQGKEPSPDGKDKVLITVNGQEAYARFFWSEYNRGYMVAPLVKNSLLKDLYLAPIQIIPAGEAMNQGNEKVVLKKGEDVPFGDLIFHFSGYDMGGHQNMAQGDVFLAAIISVKDKNGKVMGEIKPAMKMSGEKRDIIAAELPESGRKVVIEGINVEGGMLSLSVQKPLEPTDENSAASKELLAVEITVKPLIMVLWLGTVLMIIGLIISAVQYSRQKTA